MTLEQRFWAKVERGAGCWNWTGCRMRTGYGQFKGVRVGRDTPVIRRAHQVAWELTHGEIPPGLHVLHRCDNRLCVRPDHLFLGTNLDNARDRDQKGRHRGGMGERHGEAKLTAKQVSEIRERLDRGEKQTHIAADYGVNHGTVHLIKHRRIWRSVA